MTKCLSKQLGKEALFGFMIAEFLVQDHLVLLLLGLWLGCMQCGSYLPKHKLATMRAPEERPG